MKRPLAGRRYFEAQGQSAKSRGLPWWAVRKPHAPKWIQQAIARGHLLQGRP